METTGGPARKYDLEEQRLSAMNATSSNPFLAADRSGALHSSLEAEPPPDRAAEILAEAAAVDVSLDEDDAAWDQTRDDKLEQWMENVAAGDPTAAPPSESGEADDFANITLSNDVEPTRLAGPGEVVAKFDCDAGTDLGLSFYETTLVVATVEQASLAARNPNVRVGQVLLAVQGKSVVGMQLDAVMDLIRAGGHPLLLTFKLADANMMMEEGGPVLIEGDLLKVETNPLGFLTGETNKEGRHRYFSVRSDHITYVRTIGSEVVLPFSLIKDVAVSSETEGVANLAFVTPGEPASLFTITMNEKYRKPFRVYTVQAPSAAARDQWIRVCKQAKLDFERFGPWRARRNHDATSVKKCEVMRTRRVEGEGYFERDFVLYVIEVERAGGESVQIERRFSDFVAFHERWMEKVMSPYAPLPELSRLDAIKDKNDPSIVLHRMMLLGHYMKAAIALVNRIGSALVTAALQHFLQAGSNPSGDCDGAGSTSELEEGWDELAVACTGDDVGSSYEVLHTTFDVVGRWTFRPEGPDGIPGWPLYSLTCKLDGTALFAAQGHPMAKGRGVFAVGRWLSLEQGRKLAVEFETATDTTAPPPAATVDQVAAGGRFTVVFRKVCATQVFSIAGLSDENNSGEYTAYKLEVTGSSSGGSSSGGGSGGPAPAPAPVDYSQYYSSQAKDMSPATTTPTEPRSDVPEPSKWAVSRRFTEFDELRKRVEEDVSALAQWSELFPSKFSVDEVQALFDKEKRSEQVGSHSSFACCRGVSISFALSCSSGVSSHLANHAVARLHACLTESCAAAAAWHVAKQGGPDSAAAPWLGRLLDAGRGVSFAMRHISVSPQRFVWADKSTALLRCLLWIGASCSCAFVRVAGNHVPVVFRMRTSLARTGAQALVRSPCSRTRSTTRASRGG
jgi:hypothetical protein